MATLPHTHGSAQQPDLDSVQRLGLGALAVGLVAGIAGYISSPDQFYRSYLTAFMIAGGLPIGCLGLLMLHHMVGGEWGVIMRRLLEAGTRTLPYLAILVIPILLFMMPSLYEWARPEAMKDHVLAAKAPYLNISAFTIRTVIYYIVWLFLVFRLNSMTLQQESGAPDMRRRFTNTSGPGLVIMIICVTFAAFDWSMSTDPHWFSTIFGLITMVGWVLSVLCIVAISLSVLRKYAPLDHYIKQSHFHDIGNIMFAFTVLWAYMSFSQFLIIWSGNLPEEIPWFIRRMNTTWGIVMATLALIHFFIPFFLLLSRKHKKTPEILRNIAIFILCARVIEQIWTIEPNFNPAGLAIHWLDVLLPVGFIGFFIALYARELKARPLVPTEPERIQLGAHH
jgi:hypothetical protein